MMTTGEAMGEHVYALYLEKAKWFWRFDQALNFVYFLVPAGLLISVLISGMTGLVVVITGFTLLYFRRRLSRLNERLAYPKLENLRWQLLREANYPSGGEFYANGFYQCVLNKGAYTFIIDLWVYAQSEGERGITCSQFPKLRGSMLEIIEGALSNARTLEKFLPRERRGT